MKTIKVVVSLVLVSLMVGATVPAAAAPAERVEFSRTECVYLDPNEPPPSIKFNKKMTVVHYRDFSYVGVLRDDGIETGSNSGVVDVDLNLRRGTGSIRGTLAIRDQVMGDFDGRFSGNYESFAWTGRASAKGVGQDSGKLLKMSLEAISPTECPVHEEFGPARDGAIWTVSIINPHS